MLATQDHPPPPRPRPPPPPSTSRRHHLTSTSGGTSASPSGSPSPSGVHVHKLRPATASTSTSSSSTTLVNGNTHDLGLDLDLDPDLDLDLDAHYGPHHHDDLTSAIPRRASLLAVPSPDFAASFSDDLVLDAVDLPFVMGLNPRSYPPATSSVLSSTAASSEVDLDHDHHDNDRTITPTPHSFASSHAHAHAGLPTPQSSGGGGGGPSKRITPGLGSAHSTSSPQHRSHSHMHYIGASPLVVSDDDDDGNDGLHNPLANPRDSFFPLSTTGTGHTAAGSAAAAPASATVAHVGPTLDETAAELAAQTLKAAYVEGRIGSLSWRQAQVRAVGHAIAIHRDRWMEALILDGHCSREALFEIKTAETQVKRIMDDMHEWVAKHHVETGFVYSPTMATLAAPRGIVQILSSCEYPLMHALVPLAAALAAGNAVMLCPNPRSPALHALLRQVLPLTLDDHGTAIQDSIFYVSPLVDFVWSADIWNPEPCLKAGSMGIASKHDPVRKSPCIVDDPDVVPLAAQRIVEAAFTSAGMWPYKPSYVITLPKLKARMVDELQRAIDRMFVHNPFFKDEYSRLPDPLVLDQVKQLLIEHTDLVAHSRLEEDDDAGDVTTRDPGSSDPLDADDLDADLASPLLASSHTSPHLHGPAAAHDASRPTPRVRKPVRPPRGGVVAGGRWHDDSLVVHPTLVVCDAASPLLTEPGQGPLLPVLALSKREMLAFVRVRQPFSVLYHFTRRRDKFAPQFARAVVINDTLSPFRVNEYVGGTLAAGAPAARALFDLFSVAQPQVFAPRNALAAHRDDRARYPPTTRGKLARLEKMLGWTTIPVPRAPWRERVREWVGASVPGMVQAVAVGSTVACVVLVGVIVKERMGAR